MPLTKGTKAPDFEITPGNKLSDLKKPAVVYFYPKDGTPGCTIEAQEFRDAYAGLQKSGIEVIGISTDDIESHKTFCAAQNISFPLVADPTKAITKSYETLGPAADKALRSTFLINTDGNIDQVWNVTEVKGHAQQVATAATQLLTAAPVEPAVAVASK